jgi:hypothetical protein
VRKEFALSFEVPFSSVFKWQLAITKDLEQKGAAPNNSKYRIRQSTSEDLYHHDKLFSWEREAYQKIDLGELYISVYLYQPPKN